jgi:hypothetical protein
MQEFNMSDPASGSDFTQWFIMGGMAIGAGIVGAISRSAWRGKPTEDRDFVVSGQASIADMQPVKDLVKHIEILTPRLSAITGIVEGLAQQTARTALSLEKLGVIVEEYIEAQKTERDNEEEVERRVAERLAAADNIEVKRRVKAIGARNARNRATAKRNAASGS